MKKRLAAAMLGFTVLASACSGGANGGNANNGNTNAGQPDAGNGGKEPAAEEVTLKLSTWQTEAKAKWDVIIPEFEKQHPGIKVELDLLNEKGDSVASMQKLDLMAASKDQLDIVELPYTNYSQRADIGMLEPLDSYIEKEGFKYEEEYLVDTKVNDKIYALPSSMQRWFILLNKDLLDEAGLPVPTDWTWDEFMEYATKLTAGDGASKRYGAYLHSWPDYFQLQLMSKPSDNTFLKGDGTSNALDPLFKANLEMMKKMMYEDKSVNIYEDIISQKLAYRNQYFNGLAAMLPIGDWMVAESGGTDAIPATFVSAFAPLPRLEGESSNYSPVQPTYMGVASKSKNKEAAYTFVRWYTSEGIGIGGRVFSGWAKADTDKLVDTIVGAAKDPSKIDTASLKYTMENSVPGQAPVPFTYADEVKNTVVPEAELYLLGNQDVDTTVANIDKKIAEIVKNNQSK
ncbi:extracellular solute-binding protein [Paenibacillus sp. J5C_2022]|uniref:ABC transporter substrate-binding protein n=1 Tax=Paenibacillus sp. J5C2022 TaxID=2977129 RepID=UPI0021D03825|nr:extracellular solute-binding protein [Paenibacillus sp. J5C2022]MCU6711570.1 extracellular solute-binding protein [Paenibacillus sp. J5C2022]